MKNYLLSVGVVFLIPVYFAIQGLSVKKIDPPYECPMVYDPVCGSNGVTYSNACMANRAGVTSYTKGACGSTNEY